MKVSVAAFPRGHCFRVLRCDFWVFDFAVVRGFALAEGFFGFGLFFFGSVAT
jgi:hypothetical protein